MAPSSDALLDSLQVWRIVPVLRTDSAEELARAACGLAEAAWGIIELTATSPGWADVLATMRREWPSIVVGVGTLSTVAQVLTAVEGDAGFLVTPGYRPDLVAAVRDVPFLAGGATPTEIDRVGREVGGVVKVFPATQLGGPAFISAVQAVHPDLHLVPTGGIRLEDAPEYMSAGATAVGVGGAGWFSSEDRSDLLSRLAGLHHPHR